MRPRGRRIAIAAAAGAILTAAAALFAFREPIQDRWMLWRLERTSPREQARILRALCDRRCSAAVPALLRFYRGAHSWTSAGLVLILVGPSALRSAGGVR